MRVTRVVAGSVALGGVGALALGWGPAAQAAPPASLAVFSAAGSATPYAIVSRVPVETDGGFLFSRTSLQLDKSTAQAAGLTLGDLGDLFVVSSAPKGTITSMPSVVNAQYPPSNTAPAEAHLTGGQYGGDSGDVRNADLTARASDAPHAAAAANGDATSGPLFSSGASTSRSESNVAADGTVTTASIATVHDVVIGPATAPLRIAVVNSIASVTIPPNGKPVPRLQISMGGAELGGVPVIIDARGISVNKQVALPADAMAQFATAFNQWTAQGLTWTPFPTSVTSDASGAKVSGAAMSFRYHFPESIPKPSDIGSDEEFRLGDVAAEATARTRTEPPVAAEGPSAPTPGTTTAATPGADLAPIVQTTVTPAGTTVSLPAGAAPSGSGPAASTSVSDTAEEPTTLFALPARVTSPLPGEARDGYRFVLLAAVAGAAALVLILRKHAL